MKWLGLVLCVLIAGCTNPPAADGLPVGDSTTQGPGRPQHPESNASITTDLNVLADGRGQVALIAIQSAAKATYEVSFALDLEGNSSQGAMCTLYQVFPGAPVGALLRILAGEEVGVPNGTAPTDTTLVVGQGPEVRIGEVSTTDGLGGGFALTKSETRQVDVAEGEWLLVQAGLAGADELEDGAFWDVAIRGPEPLQVLRLPPAPLACGWGFRGLENQTASVTGSPLMIPDVQVGGRLTFKATYGALAMFSPVFGHVSDEQDASLLLGGREFAVADLVMTSAQLTAFGRNTVDMDVRRWNDERPVWILAGIWAPGADPVS